MRPAQPAQHWQGSPSVNQNYTTQQSAFRPVTPDPAPSYASNGFSEPIRSFLAEADVLATDTRASTAEVPQALLA
ncbi:hypothetical protein NZA98_20275, partial [Escherichia coli]|nr:hypothetical protein [Escherichia coli]